MALLTLDSLCVDLETARGPARALRDVSFTLERGEKLGLVGESGCGKSMTALAIMGLLPERAQAHGRIVLDGDNLLTLPERTLCRVRGNRIGMIFQEPMTSLNPVHPIGRQIGESLRLHRGMVGAEAAEETVRLLERVGLPDPRTRLGAFPHQFSGGQRQRIMIAMALSCAPDILIADEPTTALDVTIQGQILDLIDELVADLGMALILISHDLGVIGELCDRVLVMYGGRVVEAAPAEALFARHAHPYSQGLFAAIPRLGGGRGQRLATIPGTVPELADLPVGCGFAGRCPLADADCADRSPPLETVDGEHRAACHHLRTALARPEARP